MQTYKVAVRIFHARINNHDPATNILYSAKVNHCPSVWLQLW